jgi:hypothetical protein
VRFFFAAKSSDAKLSWSMEAPRINGTSVPCSTGCSEVP